MNEHEASVANRLTDTGRPYVAAFTVWAMQKREPAKGVRLRTVTLGSILSSLPYIGYTTLKAHGWL